MPDRSGFFSRVDRRGVLKGLAGGVAAALAPRRVRAEDKDPPPPSRIEAIEITARPIAHFERARPDAIRFGRLEFRGGLVLTSSSSGFGGWSGLVMAPDGKRLLGVTDVGSWITAEVAYDGFRPVRLERARLGPLLGTGGRPLDGKTEADAESVTLLDGTLENGTVLIGFERHHRIERYPVRAGTLGAPAGTLKLPAEARRMPNNQGIEALAILKGGPHKGSVVAFAERFTRGSGYHTGWLWIGAGEPQRIQLKDIDGYNVTDAAALPDGGLLVLERYFRWSEGVRMRLRHLAAGQIAPGARITGTTLLQCDSSFEIDNMEGLGVHRGAGGEIVLTLVSDDNFNSLLQRTVLLQFALLGEHRRKDGGPERT
jgi:hypothetical protein